MSEENQTNENDGADDKKVREPRKNTLPYDEVVSMGDGLPTHTKKSWLVIGPQKGIRLTVPTTAGVGRAFFYGDDDYDLIPDDPAITIYSHEERKERKLGGIMARVEFDQGLDAAKRAIGKLIEVVRAKSSDAQ